MLELLAEQGCPLDQQASLGLEESSLSLGFQGPSSLCLVGGQSSLGLQRWQLANLFLGKCLVGTHIAQPV